MEVRKETFLHVCSKQGDPGWLKPGSQFTTDRARRNPYMRFYDSKGWTLPVPGNPRGMPPIRALERVLGLPIEEQRDFCVQSLQRIKEAAKEQASFIRDVIFEEVRARHFPQLPSRLSCIYLCDRPSLEYWWNKLAQTTSRQIIQVSATGIIHRGEDKHVIADFVSHNELRRLAYLYWSGPDGATPQEEEILFEGTLTIERAFADTSDYGSSLTQGERVNRDNRIMEEEPG